MQIGPIYAYNRQPRKSIQSNVNRQLLSAYNRCAKKWMKVDFTIYLMRVFESLFHNVVLLISTESRNMNRMKVFFNFTCFTLIHCPARCKFRSFNNETEEKTWKRKKQCQCPLVFRVWETDRGANNDRETRSVQQKLQGNSFSIFHSSEVVVSPKRVLKWNLTSAKWSLLCYF